MSELEFQGVLEPMGPKGAWTMIRIPFDVPAVFGERGRVPVRGTINGFPFRSSLWSDGSGGHTMQVNSEVRAGAGAEQGDTVRVVLARDDEPRVVEPPTELTEALAREPRAASAFEAMAYSHRKAYADWVAEAKREETRQRRAENAVAMITAGKRLKE